jgi:hypothetical protein
MREADWHRIKIKNRQNLHKHKWLGLDYRALAAARRNLCDGVNLRPGFSDQWMHGSDGGPNTVTH